MASDLRRQMAAQFGKARDEYIVAIQAHSQALAAALDSEGCDVDSEYERASEELERKYQAYRQATEDIRALNSRHT